MAEAVQELDYFYLEVPNKIGEGAKVLSRAYLRGLRKMTCTTLASPVPCSRGQFAGSPGTVGELVATPQ